MLVFTTDLGVRLNIEMKVSIMKIWILNARHKLNWKLVARTIISAGLLVWLALLIDWKDLNQVWGGVEPDWVLVSIVWIVISVVISVRKWQLVLKGQDIHLPGSELWKSYWAGLFLNNFLPSSIGGDAMRIWWVGQVVHDSPGAATSVVVERILATTGLALTGLVASAFISRPDGRVVALFASLIVVSLLLLSLICGGHLPRWTEGGRGRLISFFKGMTGHGKKLKHQPVLLLRGGFFLIAFK